MKKADIGVIGLAVMGENLILNMEDKGFTVACYNRTVSKVDDFVQGRAKGKNIIGTHTIEAFCNALARPRKAMLMIKAGKPVDDFIEKLLPYLDEGDIIIDGGNSFFGDTIRRTYYLEDKGLLYVGTGVSGGEEGALHGPSIMPGGSPEAWPHIKPIFQAIAAKVADGTPCCDWVGRDGAGHYVKMVHNGIEYGDMQMISESYFIMERLLGMKPAEMHEVLAEWNQGDLNSYLIEITRDILGTVDDETGKPMVDVILDTAGQKGTGKWTSQSALDIGTPAPTIAEAVFARFMSALKQERVEASGVLRGPATAFEGDREAVVEDIRQALYASKICCYAQGFQLLDMAAEEHNWELDLGGIALLWREGCIIRAQFLDRIKEAYDEDLDLANLLLAPYFRESIEQSQGAWRRVVSMAATHGVPIPAFSSALAYYDGYRTARLPANMIQAQRDYFGAHTYERVDKPRGEFFHTNWTGEGGETTSGAYTA
ncbi:MAG: decarboxylating NADP(+)-dependent phosphogluconate dehydrogenase [Anaerolineae bacterium]|jgi:6-phosphogluconate dehydrogenase